MLPNRVGVKLQLLIEVSKTIMDLFGLLFAIVLAILILISLREPYQRIFKLPKWDFFVSHRSKDNEIVTPIVSMLSDRNFSVWSDLDERTQKEISERGFRDPISLGIQQSSFALLFTSKEYCSSHYCMEEAVFFLKRFANHPSHIIEVQINENEARTLLKIPSESKFIAFEEFESIWYGRKQYAEIVDRIIFIRNNAT